MVLTKSELIAALQNETRILLHLASKVNRSMLDYRPTAKQRSTLELLQYLSIMGPALSKAAKAGAFDTDAWADASKASAARDFDQTLAAIRSNDDAYQQILGDLSDDDFREEVEMFGRKTSRGAFLAHWLLGGCAAYRTQLFLYLKACGREELNTMNLWAGMDPPVAAA